jgi:L-2-hydroxycarboxylate dehydrogenase (NAD+)
MGTEHVRIKRETLEAFCQQVFQSLDLSEQDARMAAAVLVAADARGIPSHGVARLWRYVNGLKTGSMLPDAPVELLVDTPSSIVIHAHGAMGAPVSVKTMESVINKARTNGAAFGCVRDSNHFGIAGYVYERLGKALPDGWVVDRTGHPARDARVLLDDIFHRVGGGILPLGGMGEDLGGHKGYGLAVMIDILCAVLCGAPFGPDLSDTATSSGRVSHFFGAIRIDTFRDPQEFRRDMDRLLKGLRDCPPAEGAERVYFAGQKEFEKEEVCLRTGVPPLQKTYHQICAIGSDCGVAPPPILENG